MLAVSSLSTYGILLAGWSANSKYAFLGSLRSGFMTEHAAVPTGIKIFS
jgi:NADH:ubiquinone oxidoreductase subunit H